MSTDCMAALPDRVDSATADHRFRLGFATPSDNEELLRFSARTEMSGSIRFSFDRSPDYLAALRVEGRHTEVLVGREIKTGRLVATGHRSVKNAFVNGTPATVAYLSGLRVEPLARSATLLARGYTQLQALAAQTPASIHLTTIMEDNEPARKVLLSKRFGLPAYHDLGRFCCLALSPQAEPGPGSKLSRRRASAADAVAVVEFLNSEGPARQFFPEYRVEDFGTPGGLLSGLEWRNVFLAFHGSTLIGIVAAWDQQSFRRWRLTGYAPWLGCSRQLLNLAARLRRMPLLPPPGSTLNSCCLALICIRGSDREVFRALLDEVIRAHRNSYACFLAGLHERDPLLPELLALPHIPLTSRLYRVDWDNEPRTAGKLDERVPYLELGSL